MQEIDETASKHCDTNMVYLALNIDGTASHEGNMDLGFVIQNTIISLYGFPFIFC